MVSLAGKNILITGGAGDFMSDISRIRRLTGWSPSVELRDGLARTVDFYRERPADYF